ncbi:MAG: (2Fe-2S)-binding protein [Gammaproteobacteria bacterium]
MYVCLCHGITESQIRDAVHGGAGTLPELKIGLGVASSCGRCADCAQQVIQEILTCTQTGEQRRAA